MLRFKDIPSLVPSLSLPSYPFALPCHLAGQVNIERQIENSTGKREERESGETPRVFPDWHRACTHTRNFEGIFELFYFPFYLYYLSSRGRRNENRLACADQKQMYGQVSKSTYPYIKPGWNYPLSSDRTGSRLLLYLVAAAG